MKRFVVLGFSVLLTLGLFGNAFAQSGLSTSTGNLLRGTVYKQNGVGREGYITIRTSWRLPAIAPVFRYDFDILYGSAENNLYPFMMSDVKEIDFLPMEGSDQPINVKLRNGLIQKVIFSSDRKSILGRIDLRLDEVDVLTEGFGQNIILPGDVQKIVFDRPSTENEDIKGLSDTLDKAITTGKRDGLIDDDLLVVLEKLDKEIKARVNAEGKTQGQIQVR